MKKFYLKSFFFALVLFSFNSTVAYTHTSIDIVGINKKDSFIPLSPFISTWETDTDNQQIIIPTIDGGYDYNIDWGDGTIETNQTGDAEHSYATAGVYTISISGDFPRIYMAELDFQAKTALKSVEQWGDIQWTSMELAFSGARNLVINAKDAPDLSQVTSMAQMFLDARSLNQNINHWDVGNVQDMSSLFASTVTFNQDLSDWDVSSVTDMRSMFQQASVFNQDISEWEVGMVTDMSYLFWQARLFNQDIGDWDVGNVRTMESMFAGNNNNEGNTFNQDISDWDVSKVETMEDMFLLNINFNQDITGWDIGSVRSMDYMFSGAIAFDQPLGLWDMSKVEEIKGMFSNTSFNQDITGWDVSSVTDIGSLFRGNDTFNQDISDWNVSSVTSMSSMFERAGKFNQDISGWDVSLVESMDEMFAENHVFNKDISGWTLSSLEDMEAMFEGNTIFNQPIGSWDVSKVTTMEKLFAENTAFNQDISAWDVSQVENMKDMFEDATAFDQSLGDWNIVLLYDAGGMFDNSSMSIASYDATLMGWATKGNEEDPSIGAEGLRYCTSEAVRAQLEDDGWGFEGDEKGCKTTLTLTNLSGHEDEGPIMVSLTSDGFIEGGFTVDISTVDGTATRADNDYTTLSAQTISFTGTVGEMKTFQVIPTADAIAEPDETLTIDLSNVQTGGDDNEVAIDANATLTILDDDTDHVPTLVSSTPADDTNEFSASSITLTFSENVVKGIGRIRILDATDDSEITGVGVGNGRVSISDEVVTIDLINPLPLDKQVYVLIPRNAFKDITGNAFTGVLGKEELNFNTTTSLQLTTANPVNGTTGFSGTTMSFTFNRDVLKGAGRISVFDASDDTEITGAGVNSGRVTVAANVVTLDLINVLAFDKEVYVRIPSSAFKDASDIFFSGITNKTTLSLSSVTTPKLVSSMPANNAIGFSESIVTLTFDRDVFRGTGRVRVLDAADDTEVTGAGVGSTRISIDANVVTFDLVKPLALDKAFYITIPASALKDAQDVSFLGVLDKTALSFAAATAPKLISSIPADDGVEFNGTTNTLTFDRNIIADKVRLSVKNAVDDSEVSGSGVGGPKVTIVDNVVTLDLINALPADGSYYVNIPAKAFKDATENYFEAILDKTTMSFNTNTVTPSEVGGERLAINTSVNGEQKIRLYPNPSQTTLNIDLSGCETPSLSIINMAGTVLLHKSEITESQLSVNVGEYKNGLYLVQVRSKEGVSSYRKFIVNH